MMWKLRFGASLAVMLIRTTTRLPGRGRKIREPLDAHGFSDESEPHGDDRGLAQAATLEQNGRAMQLDAAAHARPFHSGR